MPHDTSLITTIVAALVLAYVFGAIAHRLKMPPLVGYLVAGICVGPHSPGFIADQTLAPQLAEIGVILLMFGVGLHFSLRDLLSVRAVAVPGALLQMAVATALGLGLALLMGWSVGGGIVFGLALSVSSTVVLLKALQDRHLIDSDRGRIAVGWLIVEDLAMVLALVLIPALAGVMGGTAVADAAHAGVADPFVRLTEEVFHTHLPLWGVLTVTVVKLLAFVGFMIVVGRRIIPFILHATAHTGSRELFRLAVLAIALGVAAGSAYLFGVSLALGAFFAGMILSESELSHRAAQETLPLRDAFGVLFFVSVGMLFDPSIIVRDPLPVLATLLIVLFGKSLVGFVLLVLFRRPVSSALTISAALAQIGEFSFILAALGISLGLMPVEGQGLILAGAIVSIILNPTMFWLSERLRPRLEAHAGRRAEPELGPVVPDRPGEAATEPLADDGLEEEAQPTHLSGHVVLIGYGRVGSVVAGELLSARQPFVLIEDGEDRVLKAREAGIEVIVANAATSEALRLANVAGAACVIIAIPNAFEAGQATEQCRRLNPSIRIIARAHSDEEVGYLRHLGADEVIMGEREIGLGMIGWLNGDAPRKEAPAAPHFSPKENVLQQVRETQPRAIAGQDVAAAAAGLPAATALVAPAESSVPVGEHQELPETILLPPAERQEEFTAGKASPPGVIVLPWPASEHSEGIAEEPQTATLAAAEPLTADPLPASPPGPAPESGIAAPEVAPPPQPESSDKVFGRYDESAPAPGSNEPAPTPEAPGAGWTDSPGSPEGGDKPEPPLHATVRPAGSMAQADPVASPAGTIEASFWRPAPAPIPVVEPSAFRPEPLVDAPAFEESSGFRVVSPSDMTILPPDPAAEGAAEEAPPTFHSEFWGEPVADGDDPIGPAARPMRDVHAAEAARAAIEDGSWIAALERDLFGYGRDAAAAKAASPAPAPDPTETPQPPEEPMPPPQPDEPPRPPEQPQPVPQPVETPEPQEIPLDPPPSSPAPPVAPEPRAAGGSAEPFDVLGRREPRLY